MPSCSMPLTIPDTPCDVRHLVTKRFVLTLLLSIVFVPPLLQLALLVRLPLGADVAAQIVGFAAVALADALLILQVAQLVLGLDNLSHIAVAYLASSLGPFLAQFVNQRHLLFYFCAQIGRYAAHSTAIFQHAEHARHNVNTTHTGR